MPAPPRRTPRQARSRAMVERIVEAAARVLVDSGYQQASTNRIAREAGVSPGSVYQYFPDKEAIVAEVTRQLIDRFGTAIAPALRQAAVAAPPDATGIVLDAVLDALQRETALLRALVDRVPAVEQHEALRAVRDRIVDVTFHMLAAHRDRLRHQDLERITWTVVELSQHLLVRYVLDAPPIDRDAFVGDVADLILGHAYAA